MNLFDKHKPIRFLNEFKKKNGMNIVDSIIIFQVSGASYIYPAGFRIQTNMWKVSLCIL